jgi:4-hydroxy-3-methylbut-2-en-1-yl diphosphate reductase
MKKFNIPEIYKSSLIGEIKDLRKQQDPRKKDFTPTKFSIGNLDFIIARHFGFCFGVENAIEIAYKAVDENKGKRIFLLSQMIHNPNVNEDLQGYGIQFIMDTHGNQFIEWNEINSDDVVIIPAFGTTVETMEILNKKGVDIVKYNTTCPFVERVWKRSDKLGKDDYSIIIHGKASHEETKATFSHSDKNAPSLIIKDIEEAAFLGDYILGKVDDEDFFEKFTNKISKNFNPKVDLEKFGVINQTTMLATETQEIADYLKNIMLKKHGQDNLKNHFADTRDTLCYATNDNQNSTYELLKQEADLAIVVGGYNSSNTTHLVELCEQKFKTYFIKNEKEIEDNASINHFNIHTKKEEKTVSFISNNNKSTIILTSGASCPDTIIDKVINKICVLTENKVVPEDILATLSY